MSCPNTVALTAGFDANKTPGILCDFFDNYRNCQCKGRGHLKAHHAQALADYLAKKGSVRPGGKGAGKGAPKGAKGKSKGGKGKGKGKGKRKGKSKSRAMLGGEADENADEELWYEEKSYDPEDYVEQETDTGY